MKKYILSLDQGTTSSRAIVFDKQGSIVSIAQKEFTQYFPQPGWVEHDPNEIWSTQVGVAAEAITKEGLTSQNIAGIGITNQRETLVVWDRKTGKPVYNAIVWQDKRTSDFCDELKAMGKSEMIREKTGLVIDAYFSATKVTWILDHVEGVRERAEAGELVLGTIDTWLIWNFTKGEQHVTDVTNASRTMLFNIHTMDWDEELLALFRIPKSMLPQVKQSSEVYASTKSSFFGEKIPISGIAGDQQAALFGQMCIRDSYALEGSIFIAGAVVQWLRDGLKIIRTSQEVEALASSVSSSEGVYFVPAFAGLGAPHWNQQAQGTLFGLTRGSTDAHIARAAIESIAFQTMDVLKAMEADAGIAVKELRVDGGATINNMLMQFQSDVLNTTTVRPKVVETTAMGAAFLAGLAVGYWESPEEIQDIWQIDTTFTPSHSRAPINKQIKGWYKAIEALEYWTKINK